MNYSVSVRYSRCVSRCCTQASALYASLGMMRKGSARCDTHAESQNVVNPSGLERALCFRDTLESLPVSVSTLLTPIVCVLCVSEQRAPLTHPVHGLPPCLPQVPSVPETICCCDVGGRASYHRSAFCQSSEKEHELRSASPLNLSI